MNVLILGNSELNKDIEQTIVNEGMCATTICDPTQILRFKGEPGKFIVTTNENKLDISSVIITEPPKYEGLAVGEGITYNLLNDNEIEKLMNKKTHEKIVFVLDYSEESPEFVTAKAISTAQKLVNRKKDVLVLSKFVKASSDGMEAAYREARAAGVSFIKYESLDLSYNEENLKFSLEAFDGVFSVKILTPFVVSAAKKEAPELKTIAKKLNITYNTDTIFNEDNFSIYPNFTTRCGIYYINPSFSASKVMPHILSDILASASDSYVPEINRGHVFPEINGNKCAFCYTCYRACPHGALEPDVANSAMKHVEASCQTCGVCVAICPGEAISVKGGQETKGNEMKCKLFCCENGAAQAVKEILPELGEYAAFIDIEKVNCGGRVSADMLSKTLSSYGNVIVACCMDDACRHINGDKRACKQVERTAEMLKKAGVNGKKLNVIKASHAMKNVLKDKILNILEG